MKVHQLGNGRPIQIAIQNNNPQWTSWTTAHKSCQSSRNSLRELMDDIVYSGSKYKYVSLVKYNGQKNSEWHVCFFISNQLSYDQQWQNSQHFAPN